jgi:hypothetical protein
MLPVTAIAVVCFLLPVFESASPQSTERSSALHDAIVELTDLLRQFRIPRLSDGVVNDAELSTDQLRNRQLSEMPERLRGDVKVSSPPKT